MILSTAENEFSVLLLRGYVGCRAILGMVAKQDMSVHGEN